MFAVNVNLQRVQVAAKRMSKWQLTSLGIARRVGNSFEVPNETLLFYPNGLPLNLVSSALNVLHARRS
jgi:hypothetical protein